MINNLIRKLISYLSFWCKNNKKISISQNGSIKIFIKKNLKKNYLIRKNLKKTHNIFNNQIYSLLKKENIENFLRENFIQKMFFLHNRFFVFFELKELKKATNWKFYKNLIKENSIGNPIRYFLYQDSSGNRINHVYHLSLLNKELNISLEKIKTVFEFGAGYGCMAHIFAKINSKIKYTCFDTHYVNLLQYYYLKNNNLDVSFSKKSNFHLTSNISDLKGKIIRTSKSIFIANWSLSETPMVFRKKIIPIIKNSEYILINFQEKFEDIDNLKYFIKLKSTMSKIYDIKIIKNKFYKGNILNKQNHYSFLGKKL
jgi:putative sugar O-methyltransferase